MPRTLILCTLWAFALTLGQTFVPASSAQTVWSGFDFVFAKPNDLHEVQDQITTNVRIARTVQQGIYNSVTEAGWTLDSPADTLWATYINNPGETIAATNWSSLDFEPWIDAYGGQGQFPSPLPARLLGGPAVLHLITDNVYLDIQFTNWTSNAQGGGFSYMRAMGELPPPPTTTGDYNGNGVVDAADYVLWRATLNQTVPEPGDGADGNRSGTVDDGDYDFWREHFGEVVPDLATGGSGQVAAVPEPASAASLFIGLVMFACCSNRKAKRFEQYALHNLP